MNELYYFIAGFLITLGIIIWYFANLKSYKYTVVFKDVVGDGRKIITSKRAKEHTEKNGLKVWKIYRSKLRIPLPPAEVIEINNKGRKIVYAYKMPTGEITFIKDDWRTAPVPQELLNIENKTLREAKILQWKKEAKIIETYQPMTTNQRLMLIDQTMKAITRKKKSFTENIVQITAIASLTIIVACLIFGYGEIVKPYTDMADKINAHETIVREQLELLKEIKGDIQIIGGDKLSNAAPVG